MEPASLPLITVDRLRAGMYVVLDLGWREHPFLRSHFLIRSDRQIDQLRALGLNEVHWSPERSVAQPIPAAAAAPAPQQAASEPVPTVAVPIRPMPWTSVEPPTVEQWDSQSLRRVEDEYSQVAQRHQLLAKQLVSAPDEARKTAEQVADTLFSAVTDCDLPAARLLSQRVAQQSGSHEVGVSVLSLLLARDAKLPADTLQEVAMTALLHDIGKVRLPAMLQNDFGHLSDFERGTYRQHVAYGVELARSMNLPEGVVQGIAQHHERIDGTGYPVGLRDDRITQVARIVAIANRYMNLIDPRRAEHAMTPYQALQQMYASERSYYDGNLLTRFVRILGVYPPGTVVELADERLAIVVAARPGGSLTPRVQLLDQVDDNGDSDAPPIDTAPEGPLRVRRSVLPAELARRARRMRQVARTALYIEPQTAPEWRNWGGTDSEQAVY